MTLIDDAVAKGAKRRRRRQGRGNVLMPATVVDHVTPAMRLYREESFGPVVAVIRVKGEADAVRLGQRQRIWAIVRGVQHGTLARAHGGSDAHPTGICHINGPTVHDEAQMPFGGVEGQRLRPFRRQGGASTNSPNCAGSPSRTAPSTTRSEHSRD